MVIFFQIPDLGDGLGPNFILSDNFGATNPFQFTRDELLAGVVIEVNSLATDIFVTSTGAYCKDCCDPQFTKKYPIVFVIIPTTTTTTTIAPSTTTSTITSNSTYTNTITTTISSTTSTTTSNVTSTSTTTVASSTSTSTSTTTLSPTTTSTSTSTSTSTTTEPPFNPGSISNLWAWYKSDTEVETDLGGEFILTWGDQSGNSNTLSTVSSNQPQLASDTVGTLNTQVVRKAVAENAYLATAVNTPNISSTGVTIFAVAKTNSQVVTNGFLLKGSEIDCYVNSSGSIISRIGTNTPSFLSFGFSNNVYRTVRIYASGTTQELVINNGGVNSSTNVSYLYLPIPLRLFTQNGSFGADQGDASFAEILFYDRALTPTEITNVETYLKNKYNHY